LEVSIGNMFIIQDMMGEGEPTAEHDSSALCPFSTTFIVGAWVIMGKPVGSFSAVTENGGKLELMIAYVFSSCYNGLLYDATRNYLNNVHFFLFTHWMPRIFIIGLYDRHFTSGMLIL
jgi:hypothetical protein